MTTRQKYLTLLAALGSICHPLMADGPQTTPDKKDAVQLDTLQVNDVPIEQNIMPTSRPFSSVYGTDDSIMDIGRNVTIISREQLNSISIQDVRDFAKLTSSSYTRTNFGAPANPDIRGQSADVFQNGIRATTTSNGNGMPLDFNAIESVNIVKGPPTVIQGASFYTGGVVDFITKQPYFDGPHGSTYFTVGSYDKYQWGLDYGAPINSKMAYRFSYSGEDSPSGYYDDQFTKTESLYGAFTYKPTDTYTLEINALATYMEYTENFGINRPTQALIDHHLYQTGTNINGGTAATPADPQNAANVQGGGNTIAFGPEVTVDPHSRLLKPGDDSLAKNFRLQAIQTAELDGDTKLVNNNLFTYTKRDTISSYYYSEVIDPTITFESRLEFQKKLDKLEFNAGVAGRFTHVKAYDDFFFEPASVWDLTQAHSDINVYNSTAFQGSLGSPIRLPIPGYPGRYATPGLINGDTNDSYSYSGSPFIQGNYKITNKLSAVAGARVDFLHVDSKDPLTANSPELSTTVGQPNVNGTLNYKVTPKVLTYATINYSQSSPGAVGVGGGYSPTADHASLTQPAYLYEVGSKYSLMGDKLFLGTALYHQSFTKPGTSGSPATGYHYDGAELELNYQPNKNFFATFSGAYINAIADSAGFEAINSNLGTIYPEVQAAGPGKHRAQGLPHQQYNALVSYTFDNGFGASLNGTVTSQINNNWAGTIVIPWQFQIDGSVFYTYKHWTGKLAVTNITNEFNFAPPNGVYGNESILILPGTQAQFTVTYKF